MNDGRNNKMKIEKNVINTDVAVILHNIRSTENVGAIFRTSDAAGVGEIIISGYTPAPKDRFNRKNSKISKTALGAEETIPWQHSDSLLKTIKEYKKKGYKLIALEQDDRSVDYKNFDKKDSKILFLVGNEVDGVDKDILDLADTIIEIPMLGKKESLNVSVSFGVALFRILNI